MFRLSSFRPLPSSISSNRSRISSFHPQRRWKHSYEYDLVVIGGGSGGLATAQEAAKLTMNEDGTKSKKIAVLDFVRPSPAGSSWGLGGTCVNVGCIPKKLMHQAAILGQSIKDSSAYGWELPSPAVHNWSTMVQNVQNHVKSLNFGYRSALTSKHVEYINAYGSFVDPHTVNALSKNGKTRTLTADKVLIAVGGRPKELDVPGGEYSITSDDLFSMKTPPGKTLVIGASYVALECAGFLHGLGSEVKVMARSIFLRGFDQQMAELIADQMKEEGVQFIRPGVPTKIEKLEEKNEFGRQKLKVFYKNPNSGEEITEIFDTVLVAIGRKADTKNLGLEKVGIVPQSSDGKLEVQGEKTNVENIFGLGDVIKGNLELTPVAIRAGRLLARRLFANGDEEMDYSTVPTTVFTPLEYGACGLTEEDAVKKYGKDGIEIYHSNYTPLEWTLPHRPDNQCYVKCIYERGKSGKLVGIHILGPNAGEILQGFGVAMKAGATRKDVERTVGIHPTCAEELVVMEVTKRSGKDPKKTGC